MLSKQSNVSSKKLLACAILSSSASAIQQKWWGFPQKGGFSQMDNDFPDFGGGFMHMPSFDDGFSSFGNIEKDMEKMKDPFKVDPAHGNVHSESFSSSSSSEMGQDGKMHTKESKQGSQKECKDGKCVVKECANGVCKEREVDATKSDGANLLSATDGNKDMGFGLVDNQIQNEMKSMNDHFKNIEKEMANTFKNAESDLEHGLEAGNGNVHTESYSSSDSSQMGEDGKMHTKVKKSGTQIECKDGICKQVECKDGVCREMMKDEASGQLLQGQPNQHLKKHHRREAVPQEHFRREAAPQEHYRREAAPQEHHRREADEQRQQMREHAQPEMQIEDEHAPTHAPEFAPKNKK